MASKHQALSAENSGDICQTGKSAGSEQFAEKGQDAKRRMAKNQGLCPILFGAVFVAAKKMHSMPADWGNKLVKASARDAKARAGENEDRPSPLPG